MFCRLRACVCNFEAFTVPLMLSAVPPVISRDSLGVSITGNRACVTFDPPVRGQFSHLVVRACSGSMAQCHNHHVAEPQFGKACIVLNRPPADYAFQLLAYDGPTAVFESDFFRAGASESGNEGGGLMSQALLASEMLPRRDFQSRTLSPC